MAPGLLSGVLGKVDVSREEGSGVKKTPCTKIQSVKVTEVHTPRSRSAEAPIELEDGSRAGRQGLVEEPNGEVRRTKNAFLLLLVILPGIYILC